jgi:tetratricopeptide (TPR) repeat protein
MLKRSLFVLGLSIFTIGLFAQSVEEAGAKYNEGNTALKEKKYSSAVASYEEALKIANASMDADDLKGNIEKQLMTAYMKNGLSLYKKKSYDESLAQLEKSGGLADQLGDASTSKKVFEYKAKIRSSKGLSLLKAKKYDEALAEFDKVHAEKSNCAISYYGKGLVYKEKGDMNKMMENMDEAIKIGAEQPKMAKYGEKAKDAAAKTLLAEATAEITKEHGKEAAMLINDSFKYAPGTADTYYYLTIAYNKNKQYTEAAEAANKAISMQQGDKSSIYFELGQALEGGGDAAGACAAYKKVTSGPNVEAAKYQMTQTLKCG